jgi:hypothetical protein
LQWILLSQGYESFKDRNYTAWNKSHLEQINEVRTLIVQHVCQGDFYNSSE